METETQTLETSSTPAEAVVDAGTAEVVTAPVASVEGTETQSADAPPPVVLSPVTTSVVVLLLGLLAVAVVKLRKRS